MSHTGSFVDYQKWEQTDFPVVCETCLGDNPYVRMLKGEFEKECKICARPFTVFHWKAGAKGRYKKTEICQTCAKTKNVCQTCLLDLEFNVPVQVRDTLLKQNSSKPLPSSEQNLEFRLTQMEREAAEGSAQFQTTYGKMAQRNELASLRRPADHPYLKRNESHICSFFVRGQCNRGAECPYRHVLPNHDPTLAKQNFKDRYYGTNDPVAKKLLTKIGATGLTPPADPNIRTLFVAGLQPNINEEDIRGECYTFGEIENVKIAREAGAAFVTYTTRPAAEKAAAALFKNLAVTKNGVKIDLRLSWGKSAAQNDGNAVHGRNEGNNSTSSTSFTLNVPPPPGAGQTQYPSMNASRIGAKSDR